MVPLDRDPLGEPGRPQVDVPDIDEALTELATVDPDAVRVVELRFFGGHTETEAVEITGRSIASVGITPALTAGAAPPAGRL